MKIALKNSNLYLAAEDFPIGKVNWNRPAVGAWETWTVERQSDGKIALKSAHNLYLSAEGGGGSIVIADRLNVGPWEQFLPSNQSLVGAVSFRTWDQQHYLTAVGELVSATRTSPQTFPIEIIEGEPVPGDVPKLSVTGTQFTANGTRKFLKGATAFMLYRDFLDGRPIEPFLDMLEELGCNMVRVFGMAHYIPVNQGQSPFKPQDYGQRYFNELRPFFEMLASHGMYGFWTMFPDNAFIMPRLEEQIQTHNQVVQHLEQVSNSLYELTNENGAHDFNAVDAHRFTRPTGLVACVSGYGDEFGAELPPTPHWDFGNYHPPRRYPSHILDCCPVNHPFVLKLGRPVLIGEPDRYGSRGNGNIDQARMSAGASAQSSAGIVFHSAQGRDGTPDTFDNDTQRCAEAFFRALNAV